MKAYIPKNTQRNRVLGYRAVDVFVLLAVVLSIAFWVMRDKPPSEKEILADKVESLTKQIDSIEAGQLGTYDFLRQQTEETEMKFERLADEVEKTRGLILEVTK